jgi:chorismate mutase
MKKYNKIFILLILNILINSKLFSIDNQIPPIPNKKLSVDDELIYIFETDQNDRGGFFDNSKPLTSPLLMNFNDSIRLTRVIDLDTHHLIHSNISKYYAAFIYNHCGGPGMKDDSLYYLRAIKLCDEIINSSNDEYILDTISLKDFSNNEYYKIFKNIIYQQLKVDTIINQKNKDTSLIINWSIKLKAKNFKELVEANFKSSYIDHKVGTIHIEKLYDSIYRNEIKESIIKKIKEKNSSSNLTDEQIEQFAEKQIQNLLNYQKNLLDDIQKNPGNYNIPQK